MTSSAGKNLAVVLLASICAAPCWPQTAEAAARHRRTTSDSASSRHAAPPDDSAEFRRVLDAGDFSAAEVLVRSSPSGKEKDRMSAWLALYRGDYIRAHAFVVSHRAEKDFLSLYAEYMAALTPGFREKSSEHFTVRYFSADEIMADFALGRLEKIRSAAGELFGYFPPDKVIVEIYPEKEIFAAASTLGKEILEKSGTVGICKFNRLMILSPRLLALGYRWLDTLAHEYAHFVVNRASGGNCPLWAHEGLARWSDTLWRSEESLYLSDFSSSRLAAAARRGKLIPFKKMAPSLVYLPTTDDISLAFAEVADFTDFVVGKYGRPVLSAWLAAMKTSDEKSALAKAAAAPFPIIEKEWRARLAAHPRAGSDPGETSLRGIPDLPSYGTKSEEDFIPEDLMKYARLGDEFRMRGNYDAALSQYEKAYSVGRNPVIAVKIARTKIALGRPDEAGNLMRTVIEGNQNYITPFLVIAQIERSRLPAAEGLVENAAAAPPASSASAVSRSPAPPVSAAYASAVEEAFSINPFYPGLYDALKSLRPDR